MTVVQSGVTLVDMPANWWPTGSTGSVLFYNDYNYDYATIYRTQPNVRTCVDFLARNIAQLGLHVFRRVSDTDRKRLRDHPLAQVLARPLPADWKVTYYRLMESLVADLGIYFNAYWLKIKVKDAPAGLVRIPPTWVTVSGSLAPTKYRVAFPGSEPKEYRPDQVVHFRGYGPNNNIEVVSPIETLRRILAEEHAAGEYRENFWQSSARMQGVIERPEKAPEWSEQARDRFREEWAEMYAGAENSGKTAILEEGMTWKEGGFNAQESEYLLGRKLTREECARAYHIPPPLVGILDHATFSNIKEQHKHLYQDVLGPWCACIEQDVELQLLPEFKDVKGVYVEFNIQEKLQGSFEEQVQSLQSAVGRPWMAGDEARARFNLPSMGGDMARPVLPLNVLVGGQASPRDVDGQSGLEPPPQPSPGGGGRKDLDLHNRTLRERHEETWRAALVKHYKRQEAAIVSRVEEAGKRAKVDIGGVWWDEERWNRELAKDLLPLNVLTAMEWAELAAEALEAEVDKARVMAWLEEHSRVQAEYINGYTRDQLELALQDPEPREAVSGMFELAVTVWAVRQAMSAVTTALNFGAVEGASAGGMRFKTWQVNSSNPRDDHAALNGMTVGIRDRFPNGQRWPGDPAGGAEQNANCQCTVRFS